MKEHKKKQYEYHRINKKKNFHKSARSRKCRNFKNRNQRKTGGKKIRSNEKETLRIMNFNDKNRTINKERNNKVQRTNIIDGNVVKSIISKKEYYREQRKKRNLYKRKMKQLPEAEINAKSPKKDSQ